MEYRGDITVEATGGEPCNEFILVEVIGDLAVDEIAELVGARQIIDGDDLALAALVERLDEI